MVIRGWDEGVAGMKVGGAAHWSFQQIIRGAGGVIKRHAEI
jgi:FKBP-type peptidyl-prolyl cis-trans isomerase